MNIPIADDLWRMMSNHRFVPDPDSIQDDLSCSLCHELMIDPCQGVCGCQYCHKCISEYSRDGTKYCPGGHSECSEQYLDMDSNVFRNLRLSKRVSNVRVLCPNNECKSIMELAEMLAHVRLCTKRSATCPYVAIGCNKKIEEINNVLTHLGNDSLPHTELLIEFLQNLKNDFHQMKFDSEKTNLSMEESLREESRTKDSKIEEMMKQINEQQTEINEQQREINSLKISMERMEVTTMLKDMKIEDQKRKIDTDKSFSYPSDEVNMNPPNFSFNQESKLNNWINSCPNKNADFAWRMNGFTRFRESLRNMNVFSETFYSNKYALCFCLYIHDTDDIALLCVIVKGRNDRRLQWPLRRAVTLSIIDQVTLTPYKSQTFQCDTYFDSGLNNEDQFVFSKPKFERNRRGIGARVFINYASIKHIPSIIVNDSIVVSCILN